MSRRLRKLQHTKTKTNKIGVGVPPNSEGSDGDVQIRKTSGGVVLFAKYNNQWHKSQLSSRETNLDVSGQSNIYSYSTDVGTIGEWTIEEDEDDLIFNRDGTEKFRISR